MLITEQSFSLEVNGMKLRRERVVDSRKPEALRRGSESNQLYTEPVVDCRACNYPRGLALCRPRSRQQVECTPHSRFLPCYFDGENCVGDESSEGKTQQSFSDPPQQAQKGMKKKWFLRSRFRAEVEQGVG